MKRRFFALSVLGALLLGALGARNIPPVVDNRGVWRVEFWAANGPDPRRISAGQYEHFRATGACLPSSHYSAWPTSHALTVICEL